MPTRRHLLAAAAAIPLGLGQNRPGPGRHLIDDLEIFPVRVNRRGNWMIARLRSNTGLTGLGDASHSFNDRHCAELLRQLAQQMNGQSIHSVEGLRAIAAPLVASAGLPGATAFSALEQCLWDLQGKALGVPAHALLGGSLRRRIRNYANINRMTFERTPEAFAKSAAAAVAAGFDAIKLAPWDGMPRGGDAGARERHTQLGIECAAAVRKVIGPKVDLLVDGHSNFTIESGLELAKRTAHLDLFWLEELTRGIEGLAAINRGLEVRTAGGEHLYGMRDFYPYVAGRAVDVIMPDVKFCGGMLEMKKIGALGEAAGLQVSPHGPASPVGNAAAGHVCATMPNFLILEHAFGEAPWRAELIQPPERIERGYSEPPAGPGLGIELNEKVAARYRAD